MSETLAASVGELLPGATPPASNTGASFLATPLLWDYSATTHDTRGSSYFGDFYRLLGGASTELVGGLQGWSEGVQVFDAAGFLRGTVYSSPGRSDVHVVVSGSCSDEVRSSLCSYGSARTSRVDTRLDTLHPFDDVASLLVQAADIYGSKIIRISSEQRGKNLGRTVYLGSPSSRIRVRLYEKHLESPGMYPPGEKWNRVEVQLRPDSRHKEAVSGWSREQTFGASKVTRELASLLGIGGLKKVDLRTSAGVPDLDRALAAMGRQYSATVEKFLQRTGGDVGRLMEFLAPERIERHFKAVDAFRADFLEV